MFHAVPVAVTTEVTHGGQFDYKALLFGGSAIDRCETVGPFGQEDKTGVNEQPSGR